MRLKPELLALSVLLALGGCSLTPTYKVPDAPLPKSFQNDDGPWKTAQPGNALNSQWWQVFNDSDLNDLQGRLLSANPDLAAALAHYDAARAYAGQLHGERAPQVDFSGGPTRQRQSDNRPLRGDTQPSIYNSDTLTFNLGFDADLWGRLRNQAVAGDAQAQASADDLATARLSLQRQLATLYLQVRGLDAQAKILDQALDDYGQALKLTRARYEGQIASELDLSRSQEQLAEARAQLDDVQGQRALAEHAIGEMLGVPASDFHLVAREQPVALPDVPEQLPSTLLQRRPDIAAAERRVFAANAGIGVARAARYPDFSLTAMFGGQTQGAGNLLAAGNRYWAIGPLVNLPIFDGGRRRAAEDQAVAQFDEASAHYRSTVLKAVREVADNLSQLQDLGRQGRDEQDAATAAEHTQALAMNSYEAGAVSYLDVVTAQTAALQAQRRVQQVQTQRLQASAQLMVALGGGWKG